MEIVVEIHVSAVHGISSACQSDFGIDGNLQQLRPRLGLGRDVSHSIFIRNGSSFVGSSNRVWEYLSLGRRILWDLGRWLLFLRRNVRRNYYVLRVMEYCGLCLSHELCNLIIR